MIYRLSLIAVVLSIIFKLFAIHLTNFDLFGDETQYWLWSKELAFGYYSKPPFLAWLLRLHTTLFNNNFEALKYFPLIFYFFTSYSVYLLSFELNQNKELAKISAVSFYLLPSVSLSSFIISTDVVLILFCSLLMLLILKIRKNPSILNFLILGVLFGLSFLTKYAAIYYVFSLIIIIILDKKIRKQFSKNLLNLLALIILFLVVFLPNIYWNLQNDWITIFHTSDNAGLNRVGFNLLQGVEFILLQALMLGPFLFFSFIFFVKKTKNNFITKFLLSFSLPVFLIVFFESILVRANANWAAVGIIPVFLLMVEHMYRLSKKTIIYNNILNFIICGVLFSLIIFSSNLKFFDRINGIADFAKNLETNYLTEFDYLVIEDRLLLSNMSYQLRNTNKKILTPFNPKNKIKSHFHITKPLTSRHNKKFIFIGNPTSLKYLEKKYETKKKDVIKVKFKNQSIEIYEIIF